MAVATLVRGAEEVWDFNPPYRARRMAWGCARCQDYTGDELEALGEARAWPKRVGGVAVYADGRIEPVPHRILRGHRVSLLGHRQRVIVRALVAQYPGIATYAELAETEIDAQHIARTAVSRLRPTFADWGLRVVTDLGGYRLEVIE